MPTIRIDSSPASGDPERHAIGFVTVGAGPARPSGGISSTLARGLATSAMLLILAACAGPSSSPSEAEPPEVEFTVASPSSTTAVGVASPAPAGSVGPSQTPPQTEVAGRSGDPEYRRGRRFVVVDNPLVIPGGSSTLNDEDLVLGYQRDGEARAYPVGMVAYHHVINDTVQGTPLLVTF